MCLSVRYVIALSHLLLIEVEMKAMTYMYVSNIYEVTYLRGYLLTPAVDILVLASY